MGCGAAGKVTAIMQPSTRQENDSVDRPGRRSRSRFKLPAEVLDGFGIILQVTPRKTENRKKKPGAEAEFSGKTGPDQESVHHSESTENHRSTGNHPGVDVSYVEHPSLDVPESHAEGSDPAESKPGSKQKSIFFRVDDHKNLMDDLSAEAEKKGRENSFQRVSDIDESELLSPEAPRVLSDDEEVQVDSRRTVRLEIEKRSQEEAERIAAEKRLEEEELLNQQKNKMTVMEGAAQNILSKYK